MLGYIARSTLDLSDIWRLGLEQLATSSCETALVLRRITDAAVCVDRVECDHPVRLSFDVGKAMPCTPERARKCFSPSRRLRSETATSIAQCNPRSAPGSGPSSTGSGTQGWGRELGRD
jgi:hypothetical protein